MLPQTRVITKQQSLKLASVELVVVDGPDPHHPRRAIHVHAGSLSKPRAAPDDREKPRE